VRVVVDVRLARGRAGRRRENDRSVAMTKHAVVIAGAGPTGLMLAGELALAGVDAAIVERRATRISPAHAQAVCTHAPSRSSISAESLIGF
jgi:heterodisulfide reductase subunit A-like polyferredoxin